MHCVHTLYFTSWMQHKSYQLESPDRIHQCSNCYSFYFLFQRLKEIIFIIWHMDDGDFCIDLNYSGHPGSMGHSDPKRSNSVLKPSTVSLSHLQ